MRAVLLASLAASILANLPPAALHAQGGKVPKRPNLEEGADTNFAPAYYQKQFDRATAILNVARPD